MSFVFNALKNSKLFILFSVTTLYLSGCASTSDTTSSLNDNNNTEVNIPLPTTPLLSDEPTIPPPLPRPVISTDNNMAQNTAGTITTAAEAPTQNTENMVATDTTVNNTATTPEAETSQDMSPTLPPPNDNMPSTPPPQDHMYDAINDGPVPPSQEEVVVPYYVQKHDTLYKISQKIYGTGDQWKQLAETNHLSNANKIYAGDVIYYKLDQKSTTFYETHSKKPKNTVRVKNGDTLSSLSQMLYGTSKEWRNLWKINPQIINPNHIKAGEEITFIQKNEIKKKVDSKNQETIEELKPMESQNENLISTLPEQSEQSAQGNL